ncbi:putative disease resistance RPP13-like protein 1 [Eucalyptus grandis]|uniref:putative disease resistance RPP13-like protein 1 n=1 Tax=Eucalyptus grandis TaxID=71139 RepID=UPI00192E8B17|nr:putative disease resistance RPP13-like protein 1 [Eucalyptus grandis]
MPIAELFLGAFLQVLFDRLASHELLKFAQHKGIDTLLKNWEKKLTSIDQVLIDAEDRQLTGDLRVKSWLEDLRNLAYDIEDLLDELVTESAKNKSEAEPSTSKVSFLLPSCCFNLSSRAFMFDRKMRAKMEEMDSRLKNSITQKDILRLREYDGQRSAYRPQNLPSPTTHLTEEFFIGREDKKMEILELLTKEEDDGTYTDVKKIPIVGMPGLGKTALAQQVFNDDRVTNYFDVKAWACVSDDFDVLSITRSILETTNPQLSCEHKSLNWLQDELTKSLSRKKFLVVLDDLWDKNYENWIFLLKPFRSGAKGSKIIVTTRDREVASMVDARLITLEVLSPDYCMELFAFHALGVRNFNNHPNLVVLGRKIVEKCKGLPLAVKALAGLLRNTDNPREWEDILKSKIWDISEDRINVLPALKLSYLHLPSHLKRCFAYCAIFPKDYEIQQDELICWWIAEGLVEAKGAKNKWNVGLDYFNDLVNRSLILKSGSNESQFLMHDLVNDLAKLVASPTHFDLGEFKGDHNNTSSVRHASFISSEYILPEKFKIYHGMKGLRSFISLKPFGNYKVSQKVLCDLLLALKYLRVLSLSHYWITEIPDCIGELMHLSGNGKWLKVRGVKRPRDP